MTGNLYLKGERPSNVGTRSIQGVPSWLFLKAMRLLALGRYSAETQVETQMQRKAMDISEMYVIQLQHKIKFHNKYQMVEKVLGQDIFSKLLIENQYGFRGMIALVCGYAYHTEKSRESVLGLVQR
jgi:hypothetical protein